VVDQGGAYQTEDEAWRNEHNQHSSREALNRGEYVASRRCRASAAVLCRSGRLHGRRQLFAERTAHSTGSSCSIQIGRGLTDAPLGSLRNVYLVVTDIEAARNRLLDRGVAVGEIRHKVPIDAWNGGFAPGLDPARMDYASFADFSDPDGNSWVSQERGYRDT
jgi:hypothetical protein